MTPEGKLQRAVIKHLKTFPHDMWFTKLSDRYKAGLPDIIGIFRSKAFAIELKAPGKKPNAIQRQTLKDIYSAGGMFCWSDSLEEVKEFIATVGHFYL